MEVQITPTAGNHYFLWKPPSEEPPKTINLTEAQMSIKNRGAAYIGCDLESPEITIWKEFRTARPEFPLRRSSDRATGRATERSSDRSTDRPSDRLTERPIERPSDRAIERSSDRSIDRAIERSSDRATDRAIDGAIDRTTERPSDGLVGHREANRVYIYIYK